MSKKQKNVIASTPEIYRATVKDPLLAKNCLIEDVHHQFFRFNIPQESTIVKEAVHKIWPSFNEFSNENKQTLLSYHSEMFKAEPPKDQDLVTTALWTWMSLCAKATDRTAKTPKTAAGRKSTIGTRNYFYGEVLNPDAGLMKTPQAIACYKIFKDTVDTLTKNSLATLPEELKKSYVPHVTEEELKAAIIARAGELKTRQDPWRIFQYYRPTLIKLGVLKHD